MNQDKTKTLDTFKNKLKLKNNYSRTFILLIFDKNGFECII